MNKNSQKTSKTNTNSGETRENILKSGANSIAVHENLISTNTNSVAMHESLISTNTNSIATHENFLRRAIKVASKSPCPRKECRVGAIAVLNNEIVLEGVNHTIRGIKSCKNANDCIRKTQKIESGTRREIAYCICAEQDLLCQSAKNGVSLNGATIYVTHMPCPICIRLLIEAGISQVYYATEYNKDFSHQLIKLTGFKVIKLNVE